MKKPGVHFEVGQLAEMKSFLMGYRGAWFRCKIKDIQLENNKILPEYYDFAKRTLRWEKIYKVCPYSKPSKRQLMVRPEYPIIFQKHEMPHANSIPNACVVINGTWKVGDLVDWLKDGCYWSATIVKVLSDNKFQVELPRPPLGEGKEGEKGRYVASGNDFRPSLHWSETGWTLPTVDGHPACDAQLIFPTKQGMDLEDASVPEPKPEPTPAGSTTLKSGEGDKDSEQNEKSVKMDCDLTESSENDSSLHRKVTEDEVGKRELNIMHEDTLEAAVIDLQELVSKVKWMQRLLQSASNDATPSSPSWKRA